MAEDFMFMGTQIKKNVCLYVPRFKNFYVHRYQDSKKFMFLGTQIQKNLFS